MYASKFDLYFPLLIIRHSIFLVNFSYLRELSCTGRNRIHRCFLVLWKPPLIKKKKFEASEWRCNLWLLLCLWSPDWETDCLFSSRVSLRLLANGSYFWMFKSEFVSNVPVSLWYSWLYELAVSSFFLWPWRRKGKRGSFSYLKINKIYSMVTQSTFFVFW